MAVTEGTLKLAGSVCNRAGAADMGVPKVATTGVTVATRAAAVAGVVAAAVVAAVAVKNLLLTKPGKAQF